MIFTCLKLSLLQQNTTHFRREQEWYYSLLINHLSKETAEGLTIAQLISCLKTFLLPTHRDCGSPGELGKAVITIMEDQEVQGQPRLHEEQAGLHENSAPMKTSIWEPKLFANLASQSYLQETKGSGIVSSRYALCSEKMEKLCQGLCKGSFWQRLWWYVCPGLTIPAWNWIYSFFHHPPGPNSPLSGFSLADICLSYESLLQAQFSVTTANPLWD